MKDLLAEDAIPILYEWISVDDQLLNKYNFQTVLAYDTEFGHLIVTFYNDLFWITYKDEKIPLKNVTHWMPLPDKP